MKEMKLVVDKDLEENGKEVNLLLKIRLLSSESHEEKDYDVLTEL